MITWIDHNSWFFQCGTRVKVPLGYELSGWYIWNSEGVTGPFINKEEARMNVDYYRMDPAFECGYPESGTVGYDGKGWYYFHGGQLWGPFDSEEEAQLKEGEHHG